MILIKNCRGCACMVIGFTTTYAISAYHQERCDFEFRSWKRGVLDTTLCDTVCQWHAADRWFSPVSSTNKTDHNDITETFLKVALNTINSNLEVLCIYTAYKKIHTVYKSSQLHPASWVYGSTNQCLLVTAL